MILNNLINELGIQKKTFSDALGITRQSLASKLDNGNVCDAWGFKEKQKIIIKVLFQVSTFEEITSDYIKENKEDICSRIKILRKRMAVEKTLNILKFDMAKTRLFYAISDIIVDILEKDDAFEDLSNLDMLETIKTLLISYSVENKETKYLINFIGKSWSNIDKNYYPLSEKESDITKYFESSLFRIFENYRNDSIDWEPEDLHGFYELINNNKKHKEKQNQLNEELQRKIKDILSRDDLSENEKIELIKLNINNIDSDNND